MESRFKGISSCLFLLCLIFSSHAADKDFPHIADIEIEFYQTEVQVTDLNQQVSGLATEYYDNSFRRGRVDVLVTGQKQSVYYFNDTNEILEVQDGSCETWNEEESIYDYEPLFYGWLNKDPLIIGPSAPLWYAQNHRSEIESLGKITVRDIKCDAFSLPIVGAKDDVVLTYYFAEDGWTTPYKLPNITVPIRIEASGVSSQDVADPEQMVPINITTDFAYFRPTISNWLNFQPPLGIGCPLRKPTITMPNLPKQFKFSVEMYDAIAGGPDGQADVDINYQQVWYDQERKIARFDSYTKQKFISILSDFNTGVNYVMTDDETCTIQTLRHSLFSNTDSDNMAYMKEPNDILNLDDRFYYMGRRRVRGIPTDSFERVYEDAEYAGQTFKKFVVTIYFSLEFLQIAVEGEIESQVPVYVVVTGYDDKNAVKLNLQYNVFEFDDVVWPDMYTSFDMDVCYPALEDKSYFVLIMDVPPEVGAKMEELDDLVIEELRERITDFAKVTDMRIPLLKADYKSSGVFVTGIMLDRVPALKQFYMEYEGYTANVGDMHHIPKANTKEECAFACVDEEKFTCLGFYFCKEACYIKKLGLLEKESSNTKFAEKCQTWMRTTRDTSNEKQTYLKEALKNLETAVLSQKMKITLEVAENTKEEILVAQIAIGVGPYTGIGGGNTPYQEIVPLAKLKKDDETTEEVPYISSLNDCYAECKNSKSTACASFSYCKGSDQKQCRLSSVLVTSRDPNVKGTDDDRSCSVYAVKFSELFEEYPGHTVMISGEDVIKSMKSVEECAKQCKEEKKFLCRGFEYCRSEKTCVLHSKHVLDLKPGEVTIDKTKGAKSSSCTHYAAKHTTDYYDLGYTLIDDKSDQRNDVSLEECAKICSEELKGNCKSFNYCPPSAKYMTDNTCSLSTKVLTDERITTTTEEQCHHFEKKPNVDDWIKNAKLPVKKIAITGYTSQGFTGLVIGMLALGLILGAMGFVIYSYYRSRNPGDGMSVRFMKQPA